MAINVETFRTETEWLNARRSFIGGSEAACLLGLNPWKSNVDLWREKTGRKQPDDLHGNAAVEYGKAAEEHLRELFALDYKPLGYETFHAPFNLYTNDKYPWAHASLDGWLFENITGRFGVLEIKTATLNSAAQSEKWRKSIPQNYFVQILHYMAITEADYAILSAQLKTQIEGEEPEARVRRYRLERDEHVQAQIDFLMEQEQKFAEYVKTDKEPPLLLNI